MGSSLSREILRAQLTRLGREAARVRDEKLESRVDPAAREAFERAWQKRDGRRAARERAIARWSLAGMGAVTAAAAGAFLWLHHRPLSFTVQDTPGQVGAWMTPTADAPLRFSDGTSMTLDRNAIAQVTALTPVGAEIAIAQGHVSASVVHRTDSHWTLDVGPFVVHVTGTKFDADWNDRDKVFTLQLREGSVVVTGCETDPRPVRAGTSLQLRCAGGEPAAETPARAPEGPSAVAGPTALAGMNDAADAPAEERPSVRSSRSVAPTNLAVAMDAAAAPSWRALASVGQNSEALASVLDHFDDECRQANAQDVLTLANVARLAGDVARAGVALHAIRSRYPRTPETTTAAFLLGRIAFDAGRFDDAAPWFRTAWTEDPSGPLAREADGRLVEARDRAGDRGGARRAAEEYLQRYPSGPHAALAVRILESE